MKKFTLWFLGLPMAIQASSLIVMLVLVFGLIGPSMISSNSTIAVWIGIAICLAAIYLVVVLSEKIRELFK